MRGLVTLAVIASLVAPSVAAAQPPTDAGPADAGAPDVRPADSELVALRASVDQLQDLVVGRHPGEDPQRLLGVEPLDEAAVRERLAEVRAAVDAAQTAIDGLTPDAGPPIDAAAVDAAGRRDAGASLSIQDASRLSTLRLTLERDALLAQFLAQPLHERAAAVADDEESRQLAEELRSAAVARFAAEQASQRAERARDDALEEAGRTSVDAARRLVRERARAEGVRAELAAIQRDYARERERLAGVGRERAALTAHVAQRSRSRLEGAAADGLYDRVLDALGAARGQLDRALTALDAGTRYPEHRLEIDPAAPEFDAHVVERAALLAVLDAIDEERETLVRSERRHRWSRAKALVRQVRELNDARVVLLPHLSREKRERVLGLGPEGIEQLRREVYQLVLSVRWYLRERPGRTHTAVPAWLGDAASRSSTRWTLFELLALLLGWAFFATRRRHLLSWLRQLVLDSADTRRAAAAGERWVGMAAGISGPTVALVVLHLAYELLTTLTRAPELWFVGALVLAYTWYRFGLAATHQTLLWVARGHNRTIRRETSDLIFRSVRFAGRYVIWVVFTLVVADQVIGQGYLHGLIEQFAWLGGLPIAAVLLRRWRTIAAGQYVKHYPHGRLSQLLSDGGAERWWGFVLVAPAVVRLSVRGARTFVSDTAMRFVGARRALAFLFRRRLERAATAVGHGTVHLDDLPAQLREVFLSQDSEPGEVQHYPGMEDVVVAFEAWWRGGAGHDVALVGEQGVGKSAWMLELTRRLGTVEMVHVTFDERLLSEEELCLKLGADLGVGETRDVSSLVAALDATPRRVVMVDHCELLALRCVGGMAGAEAFGQILRRTSDELAWLCSFSRYMWDHVQYVLREQDVFQRVVVLDGWSEVEIGELVEARMRACGFTVGYDDILPASVHPRDRVAELERVRARYLRLLWDYSDGLPRVALDYWLRSLVVVAEREVRVRLFAAPGADALERLREQSRFALHAVVSHERLTVAEATRVLHFPEDETRSIFEMLRSQELLELHGERYRVTPRWNRAVIRYLRRKHLLYEG